MVVVKLKEFKFEEIIFWEFGQLILGQFPFHSPKDTDSLSSFRQPKSLDAGLNSSLSQKRKLAKQLDLRIKSIYELKPF